MPDLFGEISTAYQIVPATRFFTMPIGGHSSLAQIDEIGRAYGDSTHACLLVFEQRGIDEGGSRIWDLMDDFSAKTQETMFTRSIQHGSFSCEYMIRRIAQESGGFHMVWSIELRSQTEKALAFGMCPDTLLSRFSPDIQAVFDGLRFAVTDHENPFFGLAAYADLSAFGYRRIDPIFPGSVTFTTDSTYDDFPQNFILFTLPDPESRANYIAMSDTLSNTPTRLITRDGTIVKMMDWTIDSRDSGSQNLEFVAYFECKERHMIAMAISEYSESQVEELIRIVESFKCW